MAHGFETALWGAAKTIAVAWVVGMSWSGIMTLVFQSRFKTVFTNFDAIAKRFGKLDEDEAKRAQEHREEIRGIVNDHRKDMEGMRNQIIQLIQGGR